MSQARISARALITTAVSVSAAAITMGGAYIGGAWAKSESTHEQAHRLAPAVAAGFSNDALAAASGVDASAQRIADRHDPYAVAGAAARDRESTEMAARLIATSDHTSQADLRAGLRKASFSVTGPAAQPFHMAAALDSARDLDCLSQAVYYEARGEGTSGMQAVAQVILNRVRHPAFPKTVCGVVFQGAGGHGCQFSFACDGSMHKAVEQGAWRRSRQIAASALGGYVMTQVGNATHFHTTAVHPSWRNQMLRVAQVGSQIFYRFGGARGRPDAFGYEPHPSTVADAAPRKHVTLEASLALPLPHKDAEPAPAKAEAPAKVEAAPVAEKAAPAA
jgi:spore germination cell wall hydrolase CwlJ-like protein